MADTLRGIARQHAAQPGAAPRQASGSGRRRRTRRPSTRTSGCSWGRLRGRSRSSAPPSARSSTSKANPAAEHEDFRLLVGPFARALEELRAAERPVVDTDRVDGQSQPVNTGRGWLTVGQGGAHAAPAAYDGAEAHDLRRRDARSTAGVAGPPASGTASRRRTPPLSAGRNRGGQQLGVPEHPRADHRPRSSASPTWFVSSPISSPVDRLSLIRRRFAVRLADSAGGQLRRFEGLLGGMGSSHAPAVVIVVEPLMSRTVRASHTARRPGPLREHDPMVPVALILRPTVGGNGEARGGVALHERRRPEASGGHEAVEGGPGHAGDPSDRVLATTRRSKTVLRIQRAPYRHRPGPGDPET